MGLGLNEGLGFTEVPTLNGCCWISKYGHGREHAKKTKLFVEAFFARYRIQDDLLVTAGELDQLLNYRFAQASSLMTWEDRYVAYVRAVGAICKRSAYGDHAPFIADKAAKATVREYDLQFIGALASEWRGSIERFKFEPIDGGDFMRPREGHGLSL